ncbi:MAG: hypothetical protein FWH18_02415 [Marinilabiliaceae bacterium]|nr:hypothetical protein [Marinilabiliaceae bacterium]
MEAVLERKKSFRPTPNPIQEEDVLTYETLLQRKLEQQRLITAGIIEKPRIQWGFTPEERKEFDNGHSVGEVFDNISHKYGF